MLDHLEIAGDSPKLWTTISLELEGTEQKPEIFWKKVVTRNYFTYNQHTVKLFFCSHLKSFTIV